MAYRFKITFILLVFSYNLYSQDWSLPLTGKVEKNDKKLQGALVTLMQGTKQVAQTLTGEDGVFKFEIPANGDFMITVTKQGHCTKKFQVSTRGVPPDDKSTKRFDIPGISLFEPLPNIDYSVLNQPLVKIQYSSVKQVFDYDEAYFSQSLVALDKLKQLEADAINKQKELEFNYNSAIKTADKAFQKKDWATAKANYSNAIKFKPAENYPKDQLAQIDIIIKDQEALNKKSADDAAAKAAADAKAKAEADALAKKKADEEAAKLAKAAADKAAADKAAAEAKAKAEAEALAKEKAKLSTLPALGLDKYKEAIKRADELFKMKRFSEAKMNYEDALVAKASDSYAKGRLVEIEKLLKSDNATAESENSRMKELLAKYPPGVHESTLNGTGVIIVQRVVAKETIVYIYQKKIFNWGGISFFRDGASITESTFEQETKP